MELLPLGNRVLIRRRDEVKVTEGGVHLPDSSQKSCTFGKILAVGEPTDPKKPSPVEVGDVVMFARFTPVIVEGAEHDDVILSWHEILGKVTDE